MRFLLQVALCKHIAGRQKNVCVCVCVCFSYKEGDVCEEGCTGLLADPPPGSGSMAAFSGHVL